MRSALPGSAEAGTPAVDDDAAIEAVHDGPTTSQVDRSGSAAPVSINGSASRPTSRCEHERPVTTLVKDKHGRFGFVRGSRLVNNLPFIVGFMELGNAGDFAANVWNDVPVPIYAIVFMAIGGVVAGFLSICAFRDAFVACQNVYFLRRQRREQKAERQRRAEAGESLLDMDVYLAVTFRELGSETIARWFMDLLLGFGAVLICVGTFMAIGGANRKVWLASNLLSGYIGNAPIAVYGLVNSGWCGYIFSKAQSHITATAAPLKGSQTATLIKRRSRNVQTFCIINGTATILGGVGSMITATRWWGYVILAPVIVSSVFCNVWWRRRVGYTRAWAKPTSFPALVPGELVAELEFAARAEITIRENKDAPMEHFVADPTSLPGILAFFERYDLFDSYCMRLVSRESGVRESDVCDALGGSQATCTKLHIGIVELLALDKSLYPRLLDAAHNCLRELGAEHFRNRERYTAELLGTYYLIAGSNVDFDGIEDAGGVTESSEK
ncbi:integral membrane protein [Purpureocillium lavendulum]|uniref:Integral membrane protein n=1 Tax=Purpureocillium lavendulum TaxID=1247861 RepID=A0AB34FPY0_9HYPO|nr:integral membrane protein [Purpureocillium lavendulum]